MAGSSARVILHIDLDCFYCKLPVQQRLLLAEALAFVVRLQASRLLLVAGLCAL